MYKQTTCRVATCIPVASVLLISVLAKTSKNMAQKHAICAYIAPKTIPKSKICKEKAQG